jgi:hypothetical protein
MRSELNRHAERRVLSFVPNNSELRTYNSELGKAVDSELSTRRRWFSSIAVEQYHPDGPHHSNKHPYEHDLTEYL